MLRRLIDWVGFAVTQPRTASHNGAGTSTEAGCEDVAGVLNNCIRLGKAALGAGQLEQAMLHYRTAAELAPGDPDHLTALAYVMTELRRYEEAWPLLEEAVRLRPDDPDIHFQRGDFQLAVGELANARQCYLAALALRPDSAELLSNLGHVQGREGDAEAAIASFDRALQIDPGHFAAHSNLLWALSFQGNDSGERYLREAFRYGQKVGALARPFTDWSQSPTTGKTPRPLRVGMVSGDFRQHPVGVFLEGVLAQMHPEHLELLAYSMNPQDDALTERIRPRFSKWMPIGKLSDESAASAIHGDAVDILIDLTGHSAYNRLPVFAWRPAPVQVSWLGYLASTGVDAIDYVLADPISVPEELRKQFTEKIWYLPETVFCFTPPPEHPLLEVTPPPALRNRYVTFGSFQRINKLSEVTLRAWARIFEAIPQAKLLLRNEAMNSAMAREGLLVRLRHAGIDSNRVILGGYVADRNEYLAAYRDVDIVLDTFPHPGATTTCEALWMGVPTITLAGTTMLERIGASMMACAGVADWIASSEAEYVALATNRAVDADSLAQMRCGLRRQVAATPLFDAARFATHLEDALVAIWQCQTALRIR